MNLWVLLFMRLVMLWDFGMNKVDKIVINIFVFKKKIFKLMLWINLVRNLCFLIFL